MKPRILIFSIAYDPLLGGAELAVRNLTDRLSSYRFDLITCRFSKAHPRQEQVGNVNVYRVGFGRNALGRYLFPVLAFRLAARLHRQHPYQIVWSIMAAYAGAAALMFLRRFPKTKFLLTLQEGDPEAHIHQRVRGFRKQWQRIFQRADYITAISQYLADWAKKEGATCPVEVVPNGVNPLSFSPSLREGGDERGGRKIVITTSRLVPKNGINILIKAIAVIARNEETKQSQEIAAPLDKLGARNDSKLRLQILGTGPEEKKLKKLAKELKVDEVVEFLGNVDPEKIPEFLANADIFVRPSRSEGLGTAFLEAMAAGLPVIATPVGGIVDFLVPYKSDLSPVLSPSSLREDSLPSPDGAVGARRWGGIKGEVDQFDQNGLFCNPEDPKDLAEKILLLLENEKLRQELGQNGRRLVEKKYDWDQIAQKIAAIFAGLVPG